MNRYQYSSNQISSCMMNFHLMSSIPGIPGIPSGKLKFLMSSLFGLQVTMVYIS